MPEERRRLAPKAMKSKPVRPSVKSKTALPIGPVPGEQKRLTGGRGKGGGNGVIGDHGGGTGGGR